MECQRSYNRKINLNNELENNHCNISCLVKLENVIPIERKSITNQIVFIKILAKWFIL